MTVRLHKALILEGRNTYVTNANEGVSRHTGVPRGNLTVVLDVMSGLDGGKGCPGRC